MWKHALPTECQVSGLYLGCKQRSGACGESERSGKGRLRARAKVGVGRAFRDRARGWTCGCETVPHLRRKRRAPPPLDLGRVRVGDAVDDAASVVVALEGEGVRQPRAWMVKPSEVGDFVHTR